MPDHGRRGLIGAGLAGLPFAARGQGAAWPGERPIGFIVPFPPGGGTDVMARAMVPHLERHLPGARFVVLNRPGAGAEVGYTALANAAPDGFTMGVVIIPGLQTITIERAPRYRLEDLAYLGSVVDDPGGFFVAPDSPIRTLSDLAAHARANPDKVAVGTWAHWQLALSYARYLSPAFHLWCNTVVRAAMERRAGPPAADHDPLLLHLARQFRALHRRLDTLERHAADLMFLQLSAQDLLLDRRRDFSGRSQAA